jgi:hypothetical protein
MGMMTIYRFGVWGGGDDDTTSVLGVWGVG